MKYKIVIAILSFVPFFIQAQTDSVYCKEFTKKVNDFRKIKSMKQLDLNNNLSLSAEVISKRGKSFKDAKGKYIKDSILTVLQTNNVFDYQFEILEKAKTKKTGLIIDNILSSDFQNELNDSLLNTMGLSSVSGNEIVIMTKHYIDIDPIINVTVNGYMVDGANSLSFDDKTIEIEGYTQLNNLNVYSFESSTELPKDFFKMIKDKTNHFKIRINSNNVKNPKGFLIKDSTGTILTLLNF